MKRRSSYKLTFFDRHGPAGAHRLRAMGLGIMVFFFTLPMFGLASVKWGLGVAGTIAFTLAASAVLSGMAMYFGLRGGQAAGDVMQYVTAGGSSTPYEEQFSEVQALVMQRDYLGAAALFEHRIAHGPPDPRVLVAAADLYRTHAENPKRAAELYRQVQRLPDVAGGHDVYVSNKLADLYLGPLKEPGRALVEFRRLIHRYPNSRTAEQARMALSNLKADVMNENASER